MPSPSLSAESMLYVAFISIAIGIALGSAIVILIQIQRRATVINSMASSEHAIGQWGVVEVPFNHLSRGKVRVTIKGSAVDLLAITDVEQELNPGDRVFVIAAQGNRILVVPESQMNQ